jgi:uncharacterized protein YicC (UPF0701 family)
VISIIQGQPIDLLEGLTIVLSVVSLIITIGGFFASLKFYRDGVELQNAANRALTKLEEKTAFIQTQVGGMFDKTLDAAIGKREILSNQFEEVNEQLEKTKAKLIEESIEQIGAAGEQEQKRLSSIVDKQIALIRQKVETVRESAEEMVQPEPHAISLQAAIQSVLDEHPEGLTFDEISQNLPVVQRFLSPPAEINRRLRELVVTGHLERRDSKYYSRQS